MRPALAATRIRTNVSGLIFEILRRGSPPPLPLPPLPLHISPLFPSPSPFPQLSPSPLTLPLSPYHPSPLLPLLLPLPSPLPIPLPFSPSYSPSPSPSLSHAADNCPRYREKKIEKEEETVKTEDGEEFGCPLARCMNRGTSHRFQFRFSFVSLFEALALIRSAKEMKCSPVDALDILIRDIEPIAFLRLLQKMAIRDMTRLR